MGFDRFKHRVCFDSMHVNHPNISGLISDGVSASHPNKEVGQFVRYLAKPCLKLLLCIRMVVSSEERRSVDKYDIRYSLQVPLRFISQFTSNRLNVASEGMLVSADFDQVTFRCCVGELRRTRS